MGVSQSIGNLVLLENGNAALPPGSNLREREREWASGRVGGMGARAAYKNLCIICRAGKVAQSRSADLNAAK